MPNLLQKTTVKFKRKLIRIYLKTAKSDHSEEEHDSENELLEEEAEDEEEEEEESEIEEDVFNDPDFQHMSDSDLDANLPLFENTDSEAEDSDDKDEDKREKEMEDKMEKKERELASKTSDYMAKAMNAIKSRGSSLQSAILVEDKFFKLDEMEQFLDAEDAKAMRGEDRENEDIDLFDSDLDGEDEGERTLKYKDFFDPVEAAAQDDDIEREDSPKDLLESDDDDDDEDAKVDLGEDKSTHELRTMRLQQKIAR